MHAGKAVAAGGGQPPPTRKNELLLEGVNPPFGQLLLGGVNPPQAWAHCCWGGLTPPSPEKRIAAAFPTGTLLISFRETFPYIIRPFSLNDSGGAAKGLQHKVVYR